ncbi:MAG TPA: hypothetical protein VHJ39_15970 [Solirubrobacteraceae bacterium]|jgi:hypothetical protein|nr:hypothetical protein [Solirubrobacteraceae bacterium]
MSRTDVPSIQAVAHSVHRSGNGRRAAEDFAVTVTTTPRMPVATAHVYTLATVREIPPVPRPGTFDSTW